MVPNGLGGCSCPAGTTFHNGRCTHVTATQQCPTDRPVGSPPNCCPRGTHAVGTHGACVQGRGHCPADRPVGAYPNCCPQGSHFENGACRQDQVACRPGMVPKAGGGCDCPAGSSFSGGRCVTQSTTARCPPDRPVGSPPNCCPHGMIFVNGFCRRPVRPSTQRCPAGQILYRTGVCGPPRPDFIR
jgi:hypothetical protein